VSQTGVVTGVSVGNATVTATIGGKSAQRAITVQAVSVSSVEIGTRPTMLRTGDTLRLTATVRDDNGAVLIGRAIVWKSSAPLVATIDSLTGLVTAFTSGSVTFTAICEGESDRATITVFAPVATVTVNKALDTLEAFDVLQLTATLRDGANNVLTGRAVRWTVSDPTLATRVFVIRYRSITTGSPSQEVCPWNQKFSLPLREQAFRPRAVIAGKDALPLAREILAMSDEDFRIVFRGSPMKRAKLRGLKRNAAIVLDNVSDPRDVTALSSAFGDSEDVVRAIAAWALERISD